MCVCVCLCVCVCARACHTHYRRCSYGNILPRHFYIHTLYTPYPLRYAVCVFVCVCLCVCVCVCVCVVPLNPTCNTHIYTHMQTHTHTEHARKHTYMQLARTPPQVGDRIFSPPEKLSSADAAAGYSTALQLAQTLHWILSLLPMEPFFPGGCGCVWVGVGVCVCVCV